MVFRQQEKNSQRLAQVKQQYEERITNISEELARKEAAYQSLRERQHSNQLQQPAVQLKPLATGDEGLSRRVEELELQVQEMRQEVSIIYSTDIALYQSTDVLYVGHGYLPL